MGKHSLMVTISIVSLILVLTIISVLESLNNKIDIKNMLFAKNAVNKAATIAEKMVLEKLEDGKIYTKYITPGQKGVYIGKKR